MLNVPKGSDTLKYFALKGFQLKFTTLKQTIERLEKGVKYVQS